MHYISRFKIKTINLSSSSSRSVQRKLRIYLATPAHQPSDNILEGMLRVSLLQELYGHLRVYPCPTQQIHRFCRILRYLFLHTTLLIHKRVKRHINRVLQGTYPELYAVVLLYAQMLKGHTILYCFGATYFGLPYEK